MANFPMDASPAVPACFSGNDTEILQDQRTIRELSPCSSGVDGKSAASSVPNSGNATALSHHLTYIEIDEAGAVPGTRSPYREQPSKRDTSLRNAPLRMGD